MAEWKDHLPAIGMVFLQFLNAVLALLNRAALLNGMSQKVFIFYRQAIASLLICPTAYYKRRGANLPPMETKSFFLIFVTAFIGVILYQTTHFEGLYLASSSIANAVINLNPALTFMISAILGLEKVNFKALTSLAKILGTTICVGGAVSMALLRGHKLYNIQFPPINTLILQDNLEANDQTWLLGCLFLFASCLCWSVCLILQVPIATYYPDHLSVSAWMCFFSTLQAGVVAFLFERDPSAWNFSSTLELTACFVSGIFGSAVRYFILSWCISRRGPFYSAMFSPLCTVITFILAFILLHENVYIGSVLGAMAVIVGLYLVLWGKAKEMKHKLEDLAADNFAENEGQEKMSAKADLEQPLLTERPQTSRSEANIG